MKHVVMAMVAALVMLSGALLTAAPHHHSGTEVFSPVTASPPETITFSFSPPELHVGEEGTVVWVAGADRQIGRAGAPALPYATRALTFPAGTRIREVVVQVDAVERCPVPRDVAPATGALPLGGHRFGESLPDPAVYSRSELYPDGWVQWHTGAGLQDGEHVLFLSVQAFPVRYAPAAAEMSWVEKITVEVRCELPPHPLFTADHYDLLVIAPQEFSEALQPLMAHKEAYGVAARLVTLDEIYDGTHFEVQGRDEPERVKYFIKNAVENWGVQYVMLVGNPEHVPCREVYSYAWSSDNLQYSDHYYADIYDANMSFCSWDSNGNDRFGEVYDGQEDAVDLYADVHVGRLSCSGREEVETVVDKIIAYESGAHGQDWFDRMILLGGDTFPGWGVYEGEVVNAHVAAAMPGFEHVFIQMQEGNFLPHRINQLWSQGAGFVSYSGHGFEYGFGTYPHDSRWMIAYYTPYLLAMRNGEKLPIVFFDACLTAKLDYYMLGLEDVPCFAWCLVKKADGGAIATIGATESATTTVDEGGPRGQAGYMNLHFFMAYEPGINLADMLVAAQNDYLNDVARGTADQRLYVMTVEQFILLGDPILKVGGYP